MTEEIRDTLADLQDRVVDLENEREALSKLPEAVAELRGAVSTLADVTGRLNKATNGVERVASIKVAIQFAAIVITPIVVALIGGYFLLKTSGYPSTR